MAKDDRRKDQEPRIVKVDRRRFLGRAVAAAGAGVAAGAAAESTRKKQETTLDRFRLMIEPRAFTHPVHEVYPVLDGEDPRLVASSTDRWLGIWTFDKASEPRFKGSQRHERDIKLVKSVRGHRRPQKSPSTVSEDGNVVAWYEHVGRKVLVYWKNGRVDSVSVPSDRGVATALGLGPNGAGLAVAMELGGIMVFDLSGGAQFVAECSDSNLAIHHLCKETDPCEQWAFAPCVCDVVSARSSGEYSGAAISQWDKFTGTVTISTLPCGSAIPPGAVCVCNCVAVPASTVTRTICTCNLVCTCNTVSAPSTTYTYTYTYTYWYPN